MVEVVASIVGIAAFGTEIVDRLFKFGCNVSAAREQTARIGDRISDYVTILDMFKEVIEQDPSFISTKAKVILDRLCDRSHGLFDEIVALLPHGSGPQGRETFSFKDRVVWTSRKSKIDLLLGQIEQVKSSVHLLVTTTLFGKTIRSYR